VVVVAVVVGVLEFLITMVAVAAVVVLATGSREQFR